MSMDIRSFFTTVSKKVVKTPTPVENKTPSKKRSKPQDTSNEDIIFETPTDEKKSKKTRQKKETKRRRIHVVSDSESDEEKSTTKSKPKSIKKDYKETKEKGNESPEKNSDASVSKKVNLAVLREKKKEVAKEKPKKSVNPFDAFGDEPVKQTITEKPKANTELNIHEDDDFEKTLLELDEEQILNNAVILETPEIKKSAMKVKSNSNNKKQINTKKITPQKITEVDKSINVTSEINPRKISSSSETENKKTPKKIKDPDVTSTPKSKSPTRKRKISDNEDCEVDPDQERFEKKRYSAMLYQKYLNRSGPAHHGEKWIPKGNANCLKSFTFIVTGVFDSLTREEAENLIVEHGGRCVHSISKKTSYIVVGDDAGPSKLEKARNFGTKTLSEDELIDLICTKSGIKNKNLQQNAVMKTEEKNKEAQGDGGHLKQKQESKIEKKIKVELDDSDIPEITVIKKEVKAKNINGDSKPNILMTKPSTSTTVKPFGQKEIKTIDIDQLAWVDKYKPSSIKQIIGQQGDNSNVKKLMRWLQSWYKNQNGKTKLVKPSPWAKNDDGAYFKAALLSGPPGVGKTTTANVVCKELGFDVVEFNASDTRNKKMIHEEVAQLLKTTSLAGYFTNGTAPSKQHVLLMDEVDGMSGNEDRGGMQELITLIKNSNIPIICMCNDRQHPKIRSLAGYCFDLRYAKPRLEQIRGAMMSICYKENIDISPEALSDIIVGSGMDIRQTLNHLSMWSAKENTISKETAEKESKIAQKDVKLGPWEVIRKVFTEEEHKNMSIDDKYGLFFYDYSIGPLFVQENYLQVMPHCPKEDVLKRVAYAADSISLGDLVDSKIRSSQSWGLLETQALYSSVIPGDSMEGHFTGQINFPGWLGKNSKRNKFQRMLSELQAHMRTSISGSKSAVNLDYLEYIRDAIVTPLAKEGTEGISKALGVMQEYHLLRDDLTNIVELAHWARRKDIFASIDPKVKAAFTRAYNKDSGLLPYAIEAPIKKKRGGASQEDEEMLGDDNNESSEEEDKDNLDNDAMIKAKKPTSKAKEIKEKGTKAPRQSKAPSKPRGKRGK